MNRKRLFAASYGHFSIDILNASIAIILTAVAQQFELSVSQIGLAAMIYTFSASLTQPLFGFVVDKFRGRFVTGLGLLWTMVFFALAPFMPNYPLLVTCLTIGALGSGAFHPAGMVNATIAGGHRPHDGDFGVLCAGTNRVGAWSADRRCGAAKLRVGRVALYGARHDARGRLCTGLSARAVPRPRP